MDVEIFTLCDAAAAYDNRLNILGVFDTIWAASLPSIHPFCSVALRLRFEMIERGSHKLALHIVDHDGNMMLPPLEGEFPVNFLDQQQIGSVNLVLNLGGLPLTRYGVHEVKLAIDGHVTSSVPFWVKAPQGGQLPSGPEQTP